MKFVILKRIFLPKQIFNGFKLGFSCDFPQGVLAMSSDNVGNDESGWRGVPLNEMYGSQSPWGAPEFPLVAPAFNHTVLYHVPSSGGMASDRPPKPQIGHDKWDQEHVRMPCSSHSLYPVTDSNSETRLKKRWEMIESALTKPILNSQELAEAILSYNTKFRSIWKFRGLHKLFNEYLEEEESQYFFSVTLPEIAKLALALPRLVQAPIPLLKQHKNRSISLSQQQIASLLANAFFCTFPRRNTTKRTSEYAAYPFINFNTHRLYEISDSESNLEKIKSICHYFRRVCTKVPVGVVTFARRSVPPRGCPQWGQSDRQIASLPLHVDSRGTIEDAHGLIQVDFANKFLGGGVLGHGCVQEEIRFVICPELMISMLFTEVLRPNEALMIIGCERYSRYTGYSGTFQWAGDFADGTPRDSSGRRRCAVLAIDAVPYSTARQEHKREAITRELNKAWVGFSYDTDDKSDTLRYPGVATGNWGCGAFGGSPQLKTLLQAMVCAQARRPMAYYTFGDVELRDYIADVYNLLARHDVTVGQLYKCLLKYSLRFQGDIRLKLYPFLEDELKGEGSLRSTGVCSDENKTSDDETSGEKTNADKTNADKPSQSPKAAIDKVTEQMETSMTELYIPETVISIEEDSPDLFSQDEMDVSMTENTTKESTDNKTDENTKQLSLFEKQNKDTNSKEQKITRPSLFDAIQKLDGNASVSNGSATNSLLGNTSHAVSLNDSNASMDNEDKSDPETEVKKKVNRKITDYFSKKPV